MVINIGNYNWDKDVTVEIYINGVKAENVFELRSNEYVKDGKLTIEQSTGVVVKIVE